MRPAIQPIQRPPDAKLLHLDTRGHPHHLPRRKLASLLHPGDLVIANDAATLPASLHGLHLPSGAEIEVRLAGRRSLSPRDPLVFTVIVFGAGDFHTRTEDRPAPPTLHRGDGLRLGPLAATVLRLLDHPRLVLLRFEGEPAAVWAGLAAHGRPIQYAHLPQPLQLWDVWTPIAAVPAAFEPPSAGFALDWELLAQLRRRGVGFATLTHAAGISSTGDPALDARLPFDEPYRIPAATAAAIREVRAHGGRVIAIGTTVVRALEHAARHDGRVHAGDGLATQRIGAATHLRVVDAILSGTHEVGSSHYELLRAFADAAALHRADHELGLRDYSTHEFGDSVLIERSSVKLTRERWGGCRTPSAIRESPGFETLRSAGWSMRNPRNRFRVRTASVGGRERPEEFQRDARAPDTAPGRACRTPRVRGFQAPCRFAPALAARPTG